MRWAWVLVVVATRVAVAQPAPELATEFQAGVDAFRLGHYDEARDHLDKARALNPKLPGPHRFLAAVAQAQGRWQDCLDGAREALVLNPASQEAPETKKLHDDCRTSAGRTPYRGPELGDSAAIAVTTNVPGATVKIGGLTYGGTPLAPRPITAGTLEVDVAKPGWKPAHVEIAAPSGIVTDVAIDLEPAPDAKVGSEVDVKPAEKPTVGWLLLPGMVGMNVHHRTHLSAQAVLIDGREPTGDQWSDARHRDRVALSPGIHLVEVRELDADPWRRRVRISAGQTTSIVPTMVDTAARESREHLGLGLVAGGGALLVGGFVAALISEHASADAREIVRVETARDPTQPLSGSIEPVHTRADLDAARSRADTFAIVSEVTLGAALVTAGIGAYYLYRGERERTDIPPPFAVTPVSGGATISKVVAW